MVFHPQLGGDTFQDIDSSKCEVLIVLFDNFEARLLGWDLELLRFKLRKVRVFCLHKVLATKVIQCRKLFTIGARK